MRGTERRTGRLKRRRAVVALLSLAAATGAAACLDMSGPGSGPLSISTIHFAWPSVVVGDTLRDNRVADGVAPVSVVGFTASGDTVRDEQAVFFLADTVPTAHLDGANRLIGDSVRAADSTRHASRVRVVATLGRLQVVDSVLVVQRPDTIAPVAASTTFAPETLGVRDTLAHALTKSPLTVTISHYGANGLVPVPGWIVSYRITRQLAHVADPVLDSATVGNGTIAAPLDTTDASGQATRAIFFRPFRTRQDIAAGQVDTVEVVVEARYRGEPIAGAAQLHFVIPIAVRPGHP